MMRWCFYFACFCIFWIKCILLHIFDKMNIIAYFDYNNAKNACFIVNFVFNSFIFDNLKKYVVIACNTIECEL